MIFNNLMSYDIARYEMAEREREGAWQRQANEARQNAQQERRPARKGVLRLPRIRIVMSWRGEA